METEMSALSEALRDTVVVTARKGEACPFCNVVFAQGDYHCGTVEKSAACHWRKPIGPPPWGPRREPLQQAQIDAMQTLIDDGALPRLGPDWVHFGEMLIAAGKCKPRRRARV
jgi:hypothetical protein